MKNAFKNNSFTKRWDYSDVDAQTPMLQSQYGSSHALLSLFLCNSHFNKSIITMLVEQCKLVVNIEKWVDINEYVCIKLVHPCWENWQYALSRDILKLNFSICSVLSIIISRIILKFRKRELFILYSSITEVMLNLLLTT